MDFVNFEIARKLKEKGYPQNPDNMSCMPYYEYDEVINTTSLCNDIVWYTSSKPRDNIFAAPAIHKVLKWLREAEGYFVPIDDQDNFELVPNKFDINTLKPFDKVLVRDNNAHKWTIDFFRFINEYKRLPFVCVGDCVTQCIPYKGNEHLLGTTNDCDEYFNTWK